MAQLPRSCGFRTRLLLDLVTLRPLCTDLFERTSRSHAPHDDALMEAELLRSISDRGGLAATHELAADGFGRPALSRELGAGRIIRVRQGWYARAGTAPDLVAAARIGGRLSCMSALDAMGIWVATDGRTHVAVSPHDCQLRSARDSRRRRRPGDPVAVHWREHPGRSRLIVDLFSALHDLCHCASSESVTASVDSFLRQYPARRRDLLAFADTVPMIHRESFLSADGICESGTETIFWLRMKRLAPRRQVRIAGIGRVDFILGERLIVEIDGEEFHSGPEQFEADRRRDAALSSLGYRVLRFSYRQVMFEWASVEAAVRAAIARGDRF
jgi:very-short-patch-repair endonuclease